MFQMKTLTTSLLVLEVILLFNSRSWAAEGIISKVPDPTGTYCHMRFPAIREESLYWDRPVLKDVSDGDIIDFSGPCDHDPLGKDEVMRQRADREREWRRRTGDD